MLISDWSSDVCSSNLTVSALPQRTESARRADDRQVQDVVPRRDLAQFIRHARAAGHARDEALGPFEHAFEDLLRARSEESRVGEGWCRTGRSWWSQYTTQRKH